MFLHIIVLWNYLIIFSFSEIVIENMLLRWKVYLIKATYASFGNAVSNKKDYMYLKYTRLISNGDYNLAFTATII
jgi:hypothetical protein